ncbi:MAG TPA: hypothetical protein VGB56_12905, partial [Flavisolibacter sp.]
MDTSFNKSFSNRDHRTKPFTVLHKSPILPGGKLCLFASFSFSGEVADYVHYYLSALRAEGYALVF